MQKQQGDPLHSVALTSLAGWTGVSAEQLQRMSDLGLGMQLGPGQHIQHAGDGGVRLHFVSHGALRAYRIVNGEDLTHFFHLAGEFAVYYAAFLTNGPAGLYIEAMEPSAIISWSFADIHSLYLTDPCFERMGRLMAEQAYLSAAGRLKEYQADSLRTRYLNLLRRNPELFQRIKQRHIASYLGVKPQSLSRIKAELLRDTSPM